MESDQKQYCLRKKRSSFVSLHQKKVVCVKKEVGRRWVGFVAGRSSVRIVHRRRVVDELDLP